MIDKNVFRNLSYGVYIITTFDGQKNVGCVVNSAMQITSAEATVAISVNHDNYTNEAITSAKKFALNILPESVNGSLIGTFGYKSSKDTDKFAEIDYEIIDDMPIIKENCGYIICEVIDKMETTSHTVFLGKVIKADNYSKQKAMTYRYYHEVLKLKSPKNAPSYIEEEASKQSSGKKYVCSVCGYVHEGEMPDDFVCPICGQGKEVFKEVS